MNVYGIPDSSIIFSVCRCKRIASTSAFGSAPIIDCLTICLIPDFFASVIKFDEDMAIKVGDKGRIEIKKVDENRT
jgi:hypothetical protein